MAFIIYALFAGLLGFSVHKKWWGSAAFAVAVLVWMLTMQLIIAYSMHSSLN